MSLIDSQYERDLTYGEHSQWQACFVQRLGHDEHRR